MADKKETIAEQYDSLMKDYEPKYYLAADWPMENGVYKQYSAYDQSNNTVGETKFNQ